MQHYSNILEECNAEVSAIFIMKKGGHFVLLIVEREEDDTEVMSRKIDVGGCFSSLCTRKLSEIMHNTLEKGSMLKIFELNKD